MWWLTNAKRMREEVVVPFSQVIWHIYDWNGGVVFYGDDSSLLIFDPETMSVHSCFEGTYLRIKIVEIESDGRWSKFHLQFDNPIVIRGFRILTEEEKRDLRNLAKPCLQSFRWLSQQEQD